jgi:hypothetical protein
VCSRWVTGARKWDEEIGDCSEAVDPFHVDEDRTGLVGRGGSAPNEFFLPTLNLLAQRLAHHSHLPPSHRLSPRS